MASGRRPEHKGPPEIVYNEDEARKYTANTTLNSCGAIEEMILSRIIEIQRNLSERAIELLALTDDVPCMILDIGCGSGLSGECLTEDGHTWIGVDISEHMLGVAIEREVEGGLVLSDMGSGLPFRAGMFDGVISISALQWLCNADKECHNPIKRLYKFFSTLYSSMARGARAVFQLYPENDEQLMLIMQQAMRAGFGGGIVTDYPNSTKAKKIFLYLFTGGGKQNIPCGLGVESESENQVNYAARERMKQIRGKAPKKSRDWLLEKKERRRRQGKEVRPDSKFTGRKRAGRE